MWEISRVRARSAFRNGISDPCCAAILEGMNYRSGNQIREDFLRFFETKGHRRVHSSSLVPHNDPTLLFTNAGMNQFKDVFLGLEKRSYDRAASSQKCVRAGGKHNDLENVGFTPRHHTFFEMLGNFSFGDYFKREAIQYAWELLTSPEWFGIDPARLYVTIFKGDATVPRDTEAERLWIEAGVPAERIFSMPAKDNFWQMGDTGPCGPCSEIFYDLGLAASEHTDDAGQPRDLPFGEDDQRYVEIWNLVFMQFDRAADGTLTPLPKPSIDTGMGLERISAVLQGRLSNYETDLFTPLIARAAELCGVMETAAGEASISAANEAASLRIIADHARAATFLISDGVLPANEGRGYVLRKILRRAIRHGRQLGQENPFMEKMVFAVRDEMKVAYPELSERADLVSKTVRAEEEQFSRVLEAASRRFDELMDDSAAIGQPASKGIVEGDRAFNIYETFGLPLDFMLDAARDRGLKFDQLGFERSMREEQNRARKSWTGTEYQTTAKPFYDGLPKTQFEGYSALRVDGARVLALVREGVGTQQLAAGEAGEVVLDSTSFYADSGGQVGDVGQLLAADHQSVVADVSGCSKPVNGVFAHRVVAREPIGVGDLVDTVVDGEVRRATMRNHTGTHLLHAALREVLGPQVKQAGSLVDWSRLRFDFSHFGTIAEEELRQVEDLVNREVLANAKVETLVDVPIEVAVHELGATALFGERYGDRVRVVQIGGLRGFSTELCGGTHVSATGEIGLIKVVGETSVSSGVRRIEALSGAGALREFQQDFGVARAVGQMVGVGATGSSESNGSGAMQNDLAGALRAKLAASEDELKRLRRELEQVRVKEASASAAEYAQTAVDVRGVKLLSRRISTSGSAAEVKSQMRTLIDELRSKLASGVVILGSVTEGRVSLIVGVTKDLTARIQAGKVVSELAAMVGGRGGGRPDIAEAGGGDPDTLDAALAKAPGVVETLLS